MSDTDDALLEAQVERAMAPYVDMLPPEALDEMRAILSDFLATHPVASRLMARLRPAPVVEATTAVGNETSDAECEVAPVKTKGTGAGGAR
jgi:hypothetical protein